MNFKKYIFVFIIILLIKYSYSKYNEKIELYDSKNDYKIVRQYLLNENMNFSLKPILWIHSSYEINARNWKSFYSRNTNELNQPYIYLTIKSIINKCGNDFNVCLIDDNSFNKLLPNYTININNLPDPIKTYHREIALLKLVNSYGGLIVPNSFLCIKNLYPLYKEIIKTQKPFICETVNNKNIISNDKIFGPSLFIGTYPNNESIQNIIDELIINISNEYTNEQNFNGDLHRLIYKHIFNNKFNIIDPKLIGTQQSNGEPVLIENLLSNNVIHFKDIFGIYIPSEQIIKRINYQWFARLNPQQVFESDTLIGNLFLIHSQ